MRAQQTARKERRDKPWFMACNAPTKTRQNRRYSGGCGVCAWGVCVWWGMFMQTAVRPVHGKRVCGVCGDGQSANDTSRYARRICRQASAVRVLL